MFTVRQFICRFASIDWTPEAVTAAGTIAIAFLTLVLAVGTLFLWLATRRLVRGAEKTAEMQLRAYVFASDIKVLQFFAIPRIAAEFKNFGHTPCDEVTFSYNIKIAAFPITAVLNIERPFPIAPMAPGSSIHRDESFVITPEQRSEINGGNSAIYIFGRIEYRDAFKGQRHTNFRHIYTGDQLGRTGTSKDGNDYS
jgi:hypothetical protein